MVLVLSPMPSPIFRRIPAELSLVLWEATGLDGVDVDFGVVYCNGGGFRRLHNPLKLRCAPILGVSIRYW